MVRCDLAEDERIVDEGAKLIRGLHQSLALRHGKGGGIVVRG